MPSNADIGTGLVFGGAGPTEFSLVRLTPRQEDLVEYLLEHVSKETLEEVLDELRVDLSPPTGTTG